MDYNSGNTGMNQGMPRGQGMPMNQGMPPGQGGMPMNQGMPPGQGGMPMNQGMPPRQGGMPMNQGMPPRQGGMPMNQGMPPRQGRMPMNQGMPPRQGGMPVNQGMPQGQGMPYRGMQGGNIPQGQRRQGAPGSVNGSREERLGRTGRIPDSEQRVKSRISLPPEAEDRPKKDRGRQLFEEDGENTGRSGGINIAVPRGLIEGLAGASGIVYGGILCVCLLVALIAYGTTHKASGKTYNIPTDMVTYNGLFRDVYENVLAGNTGNKAEEPMYDEDGTEIPAAPTALGEETAAGTGAGEEGTSDSSTGAAAGTDDGTTSGAAMVVDSGSGTDGYKQAESYNELISQLDTAIASGDTSFVGTKLSYDDGSGTLKGYPQSVVDHFVTYMSTNSDKRTALITELSNDKYSGQNGDAFVVKLPLIKFVVNMGYDDTTISLPGFSDQVVNAGQSADIAPLLPCMYTLTISNPAWNEPVTRDIEANVNEATISINIKP